MRTSSFANDEEIKALTGLEDAAAGCMALQQMCPVGVVTLGAKGCLIGHRENVEMVPAYPAKVIDTTGAGDIFSAGFLYGYLRNWKLEECASMGHRLASAVVEVVGTALPKQRWDAILQTMESAR